MSPLLRLKSPIRAFRRSKRFWKYSHLEAVERVLFLADVLFRVEKSRSVAAHVESFVRFFYMDFLFTFSSGRSPARKDPDEGCVL